MCHRGCVGTPLYPSNHSQWRAGIRSSCGHYGHSNTQFCSQLIRPSLVSAENSSLIQRYYAAVLEGVRAGYSCSADWRDARTHNGIEKTGYTVAFMNSVWRAIRHTPSRPHASESGLHNSELHRSRSFFFFFFGSCPVCNQLNMNIKILVTI